MAERGPAEAGISDIVGRRAIAEKIGVSDTTVSRGAHTIWTVRWIAAQWPARWGVVLLSKIDRVAPAHGVV